MKTLMTSLVLAASAPADAASAAQPTTQREVEAAGVRFQWRIDGARLHGCMTAATSGWLAVGFNTGQELAGARLVMGRVVRGQAHAEVHLAQPPNHHHRVSRDGGERVGQVNGQQHQGRTQVCFTMALDAADDDDVSLQAGQEIHLVLAWSHEADFQHHSAQRGALQITL
jgi:DOMON domain